MICSSFVRQVFEKVDQKGLQEFISIPLIYNNNKDFGFITSFDLFRSAFIDVYVNPALKEIVSSNIDIRCKYFLSYDFFRKWIFALEKKLSSRAMVFYI